MFKELHNALPILTYQSLTITKMLHYTQRCLVMASTSCSYMQSVVVGKTFATCAIAYTSCVRVIDVEKLSNFTSPP